MTGKHHITAAEQCFEKVLKESCPVDLILAGDFARIPYQDHVVYLATYTYMEVTRQHTIWRVSASHTQEPLFDAVKASGKMPKIIHTD